MHNCISLEHQWPIHLRVCVWCMYSSVEPWSRKPLPHQHYIGCPWASLSSIIAHRGPAIGSAMIDGKRANDCCIYILAFSSLLIDTIFHFNFFSSECDVTFLNSLVLQPTCQNFISSIHQVLNNWRELNRTLLVFRIFVTVLFSSWPNERIVEIKISDERRTLFV